MSPETIAIIQAGHAVMAFELKYNIVAISTTPGNGPIGSKTVRFTDMDQEDEARIRIAGRVAEAMHSDFPEQVSIPEWRLAVRALMRARSDELGAADASASTCWNRLLEVTRPEVLRALRKPVNMAGVRRLADELLTWGRLTGRQAKILYDDEARSFAKKRASSSRLRARQIATV